jgi:hypothetical protein
MFGLPVATRRAGDRELSGAVKWRRLRCHGDSPADGREFTAMARFQQSVVISQPAERVFAFGSDFENDPRWSRVTRARRTSPGPVGVGTTF